MNTLIFALLSVLPSQHCVGYSNYVAPIVATKQVAYVQPSLAYGVTYGNYANSIVAVQKYNVAYSNPSYSVLYELGAPQRIAALQAYQQRVDPDYQKFLQYKAFEAGYEARAQQAQQAYQPQQSYQPYQPQQNGSQSYQSPLAQHCASCHGLALESPKGRVYIDAGARLPGDLIIEALRRMRLPNDHPDIMPPAPAKLDAAQKGAIMEELLSLHSLQSGSQQPQQPQQPTMRQPAQIVPPPPLNQQPPTSQEQQE